MNVKVLLGRKKRESDTGLVSWLRLAQPNTPDNLVKRSFGENISSRIFH